nr:O-antigen ligase family protein [uncultured Carboxylicivirga sp.]
MNLLKSKSLNRNKYIELINVVLFSLLVFSSLFFVSDSFISPKTDAKLFSFYFFGGSLLLITSFQYIFKGYINVKYDNLFLIIMSASFLQATYGILQYLSILQVSGIHKVVGSFDNPAGFASALSFTIPFCIYFFKKKGLIFFYSVLVSITIFSAVLLSKSRSGIVCCVLLFSVYFFQFPNIKSWKRYIFIISIVLILISILYLVKKNSADGRLLIWRCTWEMIKDRPFGYGNGGFEANYMDYQAEYFAKYDDTKYSRLAGNVHHPFNEYFRIAVNYGVLGIISLVFVIFILIKITNTKYKNNKLEWSLLYVIGLFSLFSYPLKYPFTWIVLILSFLMLISKVVLTNINTLKIILIVVDMAVLIILHGKHKEMISNIEWCSAYKSIDNSSKLDKYQELHLKLKNNPLFLYNYAVELKINGCFEKSIEIANQCNIIYSDYDLELLLGDIYCKLNKFDKAEYHFKKANYMQPVKFRPLYDLYHVYKEIGNEKDAILIAFKIEQKEIKVISKEVFAIKGVMKRAINDYNRSLLNN